MAEFSWGALFMLIETNPMVESSNFLWDYASIKEREFFKKKVNLFFHEPLNI
jgi:hypothetical protein